MSGQSETIAEAYGLSPQQARFVEEYLLDLNGTRAAIRAGYSAASARSQASELLTRPNIAEAVAIEQQRRSERTGVTADRVLQELAAIAFADIGEVMRVDPDGKVYVRDLDTLRPEARRAIGELTQTSTERIEGGKNGESMAIVEKVRLGVKHHSKTAALKMLMDHLGMVAPVKVDAKHSGEVGVVGMDTLPLEDVLALRNG